MKPLAESGVEEARRSSQNTLYLCLDYGLRLLHPFMPFVTEELWQRLPRRESDPRSIMIANYPTEACSRFPSLLSTNKWRAQSARSTFTNEERDFETVLTIVKTARSLASLYNLQKDIKGMRLEKVSRQLTSCFSQSTLLPKTQARVGCSALRLAPSLRLSRDAP
jgi:valyl-tRNA synthetase